MPGRTRSTSTTVRAPARRACAGRGGHGRRLVAIDQDDAGVGDRLGRDVVRRHRQAGVAVPDHGPRAGVAIDEDDRELAGRAGHGDHPADVHPLAAQALEAEPAEVVVADPADVAHRAAEPRQRDRCRRRLTARQLRELEHLGLGVGGRMAAHHGEQIDAVEPHRHHVDGAPDGQVQRQAHAAA